jgi:hypothetical protein
MLGCFQSKFADYLIALLGCAYLSSCSITITSLEKFPHTQNTASPVAVTSSRTQQLKINRYAQLNSNFLAKEEEFANSFEWISLYQSLFWKRTSYLVLLICRP